MHETTLAILAGGAGSRMGQPKGQLTLQNRPAIAYLSDQLHWEGPIAVITSPGRSDPPGSEGLMQWIDPVADQGPLRGVLTGLEKLTTPLLMVVTVDMPCVTPGMLHPLLDRLHSDLQVGGACYRRINNSEAWIEPFPSVFRRDALPLIKAHFEAGSRSVRSLFELPGFAALTASFPDDAWLNLNRPQDLQKFNQIVR